MSKGHQGKEWKERNKPSELSVTHTPLKETDAGV
jgi:hypothetical protein